MPPAFLQALTAAALFGASTPLAKWLSGDLSPWLLAGLLYCGSGLGLGLYRIVRDGGWQPPGLNPGEWRWLLGAIVTGGVIAPLALLAGLRLTPAGAAALLLNLEVVFTALLAWGLAGEHTHLRLVAGLLLIVAGSVVLAWPAEGAGALTLGHPRSGVFPAVAGPALVTGACLLWALDNNLTRRVTGPDAVFVAAAKGLVAGPVNLGLAWLTRPATAVAMQVHPAGASLWLAQWPPVSSVATALLVGLLGYGVSLVLFIQAMRGLGASRAGACFALAPFLGAALAVVVLHEPVTPGLAVAGVLMACGTWLHLTEQHEHEHQHEPLAHRHRHVHDLHHQHTHDFPWDSSEPHTHAHVHTPVRHRHPHYPDLHHRHRHVRIRSARHP